MAFQWTDKINGVDVQSADDVNQLASGIIKNETDISALQIKTGLLESGQANMNGNLTTLAGRIGTAESNISNLQNSVTAVQNRVSQNEADIKELQENGSGESKIMFIDLYQSYADGKDVIKSTSKFADVYKYLSQENEDGIIVDRFAIARIDPINTAAIDGIYYLQYWDIGYMCFSSNYKTPGVDGEFKQTYLIWKSDDTWSLTTVTLATEEYVDKSSELFIIQWDGSSGNKTYAEVSQAIAEHKIPVLYQGDKCIATFSGESLDGFVFVQSDLLNISTITEYRLKNEGDERGTWSSSMVDIITRMVLGEIISADNEDFKTAVLNCFPDADEMSFPLEGTVSEVSEE